MTFEPNSRLHTHSLFSKYNAVALALIIGSFFIGLYIAEQRAQTNLIRVIEARDRASHRTNSKNRALTNLQILNFLRDGKTNEAFHILERQLDVAIMTCAGFWKTTSEEDRDGSDLILVRNTRDYRSRHPWANDSDLAPYIDEAFKLAK